MSIQRNNFSLIGYHRRVLEAPSIGQKENLINISTIYNHFYHNIAQFPLQRAPHVNSEK
mgnify:FL=1